MLALVIWRVAPESEGQPVYHFAPDFGVCDLLMKKYGDKYVAADFSPDLYGSWMKVPVQKVDLSRPSYYVAPNSVYGLVHSNVLEHVPGPLDRTITEMNKGIAPGGFHLFQVPIEPGWYREDMDPDMPPEERERVFKQSDHLRLFGQKDFDDRCLRLFRGFERVDLKDYITDKTMICRAIPLGALHGDTGHTPYMFIKRKRFHLSRLLSPLRRLPRLTRQATATPPG